MSSFDKEKILNGTDKKKLIQGYKYLKENFTKVNAYDYFSLYEKKPLSFILENSEYIFKEPYKGYEFYKNIMENALIPYDTYDKELNKIMNFIEENGDSMSNEQKEMYYQLYESIDNRRSENINAVNLHSEMTGYTSNSARVLYDTIYLNSIGVLSESTCSKLMNECLTSNNCEFMDIVNCLISRPDYNTKLNIYLEDAYVDGTIIPSEVKQNSTIKNILSRMMRDTMFAEKVENIHNTNLRYNIIGLANINDNEVIDDILYEHVYDYDPFYSSMFEAVERVYIDDYKSELMAEEYATEKYDREKSMLNVYENARDFMVYDMISESDSEENNCNMSCETAMALINESVGIGILPSMGQQLLALESKIFELKEATSRDGMGKASAPISKRIGSDLDDEKFSKKKRNSSDSEEYDKAKRKHAESDYEEPDDSDEDDEDDEEDNKNSSRNKIKIVTKNKDIDSDEDNDDDDEEMKDREPIKMTVKKRKRSLGSGAEAAIVSANSKIDRAVSAVDNAGKHAKAIVRGTTQIPRELDEKVKQMIYEWDTMDDNRRKEFMLEPGNRKKYIKNFNLLLAYGTTASINPMLTIMLMMYRKASKTKNKRVRNELIQELKTEIKVVQMKKEDARAQGDLEASYELQRIEDKFKFQMGRIAANYKAA